MAEETPEEKAARETTEKKAADDAAKQKATPAKTKQTPKSGPALFDITKNTVPVGEKTVS